MAMTFHCGQCAAEWQGQNACHCPTCHETFASVRTFDAHRVGKHATRRCVDPSQQVHKYARNAFGYWGRPS